MDLENIYFLAGWVSIFITILILVTAVRMASLVKGTRSQLILTLLIAKMSAEDTDFIKGIMKADYETSFLNIVPASLQAS